MFTICAVGTNSLKYKYQSHVQTYSPLLLLLPAALRRRRVLLGPILLLLLLFLRPLAVRGPEKVRQLLGEVPPVKLVVDLEEKETFQHSLSWEEEQLAAFPHQVVGQAVLISGQHAVLVLVRQRPDPATKMKNVVRVFNQ